MIKNYYILVLLILLLSFNYAKSSSKNLRKLTNTETTISEATELKNVEKKLNFAISLSDTSGLAQETTYNLKILYKKTEQTASCSFDGSKLNCQYNCNEAYYGSIKIPTSTINLDDENTLQIKNELTLQQTVELTYQKAYILFYNTFSTSIYEFQIYVGETDIEENAFYQLDILYNGNNKVLDCEYTTSTATPSEKYLKCTYQANKVNLLQLTGTKTNGSIKWKNDPIPDFEKDVKLKFEVKKIYGYNLSLDGNKWKFYLHSSEINVEKEGYYYTINVLISKSSDVADISEKALCKTINFHSECTIEYDLSGEKEQEKNYLIYLSNDQTDATIIVKDDSLSQNKIISREITLNFGKAYDLQYTGNLWKFKIDITDDGLREGLNVTIDLNAGTFDRTASCTYSNKILSCVKDQTISQTELIYLVFQKNSGSVTWGNKDATTPKIKIPFEMTLTYQNSYYLKYDDSKSKWTFKLFVKSTTLYIPGDSLITIDILYDESQKTIAQCEKNNVTSTNQFATFTCECELTNDKTLKLTNNKESGSITWNGLTEGTSIAKIIEFKFVNAYNMVFTDSDTTWSFDVQFEDPKKLNPTTTSQYYLDLKYKDILYSSTILKHVRANCVLKEENSNIFSCKAKFNNVNAKKYLLYVANEPIIVDPYTINWIEGIDSQYQIFLKTELTFVKGHIKYDNTWLINIEVANLSSDIPLNSKILLDIVKNEGEDTIECIIESTTSLKCDTKITTGELSTLPSYTLKRSGSSGLIWKNAQENDDFFYFILETTLDFNKADRMTFISNKWKFNLETSNFPAKYKIIIDILYDAGASTATCIKEITKTSCEVDKGGQSNSATIKIKKDKTSGTITWNNVSEDKDIEILSGDDIKQLKFETVSDLSLNGNNWVFTVKLETTTLTESDNPIEIDIKINDSKSKAQCSISISSLILTCSKTKENSYDRIKLINNNENPDINWTNLNNEIELYVLYDINFINSYGGFHENKWKFNMKYERPASNTINVNDNYALLGISVGNNDETAKCKITEKFLLCESQHSSQSISDIIKIQGKGTNNIGTVTISNTIQDNKKSFQPISISLEKQEISNYAYSNNLIKFNIKGDLKNNAETEIAEKTISGVKIVINKKDGNKSELDAMCLTNEITNSNINIVLSCEASGTINENEDDVDIKVGSDGKSNYVTFYSIQGDIKVYTHEEAETKPEESNTKKKNNALLMKYNYLFVFGLLLLF